MHVGCVEREPGARGANSSTVLHGLCRLPQGDERQDVDERIPETGNLDLIRDAISEEPITILIVFIFV